MATPPSLATAVAIRGPVEFGSSVDGEFADKLDYVGYVFEVDGPAEFDATVHSSDVDPEIWLYGPKDVDTGEWGDEIAENDDLEFGETEDADRGYCKGTAGSGDDGGECGAGVQQVRTVPASQVDSFPSDAQSDNDSREALEVEGDVAYTANRQKGVCAYDISAPADASPIGCAPPPTLPDDSRLYRAEGLVVDGDRPAESRPAEHRPRRRGPHRLDPFGGASAARRRVFRGGAGTIVRWWLHFPIHDNGALEPPPPP